MAALLDLHASNQLVDIFPANVSQVLQRALDGGAATEDQTQKFSTAVKFFKFGTSSTFAEGLQGFLGQGDLTASMRRECTVNEKGRYLESFQYVVDRPAKEQVQTDACTGKIRTRDKGRDGWLLEDFVMHEVSQKAKLRKAHCRART